MRNPLNKRLPRELKSEFGKYLVIFLLLTASIGKSEGKALWNWSCTHHQKIRLKSKACNTVTSFFNKRLSLLNAEAMLLIYYGQLQILIFGLRRKKCMSSNNNINFPVLKSSQ